MTANETKTAELNSRLMAVLGCKKEAILLRLKALNLADVCGRCGGGGHYSYNQMTGTTCFGCAGHGVKLPRVTVKLIKSAEEAVAAGGLVQYLADLDAAREAKRIGKILLSDYGNLTAHESEVVAAKWGKDKAWYRGTVEGFLIRAAASLFLDAAHAASSTAQWSKDKSAREAAIRLLPKLHQAMLESPVTCLPALVPSDRDEAIDTFHWAADGSEARYREMRDAAVGAARALLDLVKAS